MPFHEQYVFKELFLTHSASIFHFIEKRKRERETDRTAQLIDNV